jgi:hypothetical protein
MKHLSALFDRFLMNPPIRAEVEAYAELHALAERWRKRNTSEKVLKACFDKTFTES